MQHRRPVAASLVLAAVASAAGGGEWIVPDRPADARPPFEPVHLYWFAVPRNPCVYRKVVTVPPGTDRATAMLKTSGFVVVRVDGRVVYQWAAEKDTFERAKVLGEPDRVHEIDLAGRLTPGRHVVAISAPAGGKDGRGGFVLDGAFYRDGRRVAPLTTDETWTATLFRPTTILEDHSIVTPDYDGKAEPGVCTAAMKVREVGMPFVAEESALAAAGGKGAAARAARDQAEAAWLCGLLAEKGITVVDGEARGWGGPHRPTIAAHARAAAALAGKIPDDPSAVEAATFLRSARGFHAAARRADEALSKKLLARGPASDHPACPLNQSRHDRLGWLPHPELTDSDLGGWGVRVNPVSGPTTVRMPFRWRFRTDPQDKGLDELRHTVGYNIETQWPRIDGQQSWTKSKPFAGYRGLAWYRNRVFIPAEWAGNGLVLRMRVRGDRRVWLNDREITRHRDGERTYRVPAGAWMFGAENLLAVRVRGEGDRPGLVGATEIACPALDGPAGRKTPPVDVIASPLSPCVVLAPRTDELHIHHAGRAELLIPPGRRVKGLSPAGADKLPANWVLLWLTPAGAADVLRPILLTFQRPPGAIASEEGVTKLRGVGGRRIVAVRPWAQAVPKKDAEALAAKAAFWSRASRAVPINYQSVTRVARPGEPWQGATIDDVPAGPVLEHTILYDYMELPDRWKTPALKLAPLPALCGMAMDCDFRGLTVRDADRLETFQDGGLAGPHRGLRGADRVTFSYPVEPYPRFVGFTSWMFGGADTGVRGNAREMETIAATGANSYRPQSNYSDEPSPHFKGRTRIAVLAGFCRDAGVNMVTNIDETLGAKREYVREHYDRWVRERLFPYYDRLVPQLEEAPFWQVAYDLINEPFDHKAPAYNRVIRELTGRIRKRDRRHLLYVEPCEAWGAIRQLRLIEPTGDPLTVYSFHDYNFRMKEARDRWPTLERDVTDICRMWWPAFEFAIRHGVAMHCGEYGGFHPPTDEKLCQRTLLNDFLRIFDQFGMHHHYYTGRGIYRREIDGSLRPSNVVREFRRYAAREDLNRHVRLWPDHPRPK